jgi:hypothetical protein
MSRVLIRGIFSHRLFILSFQTFRISKFASALAFSLTTESLWSSVRAESAMQPTGGIFTNVDSVSKLNPHVVVDYVSSCSDLSSVILPDTAFPEHSECLFESFVSIQFPGQVFGDRCSSPDVDIEEIKANLFAAVGQCQDFDELGFIDTAARIVQAIFADESCWEELCEEDSGVLLHIESQFLDSCADVDLPYPDDFGGMFAGTEEDAEGQILTCMLRYVMETTAFEFGFDSAPPVPCFPPGYDAIATVCPSTLAQPAYDKCTNNAEAFGVMIKDDDFQFSMSMRLYDDDGTQHDDDNEDDGTDDLTLFEKFCSILKKLSTEEGLDCLFEICDTSVGPDTDMPSDVPSLIPSLSPMPSLEPLSDMPSITHTFASSSVPSLSAIPSQFPSSGQPTHPPTERPSRSPSEVPSLPPSSAPTTASPSVVPSSSPSGSPSASPSGSPSASPSGSPSASPSRSPSASPSATPSSSPTFEAIQSVIDVAISAEFSIDIPGDVVPDALSRIIEDSVEKMLSGKVNATVVSIGGNTPTRHLLSGNPLRRRRLQSVPVELLIEATELCYQTDSLCNTLGVNLAATLNDTFVTAFADGSITTYIQEEGAARNIEVLKTATVVPDSLTVTTSNVELNDPVTIDNPEVTDETSSAVAFGVSLVLLLPSVLVFLVA